MWADRNGGVSTRQFQRCHRKGGEVEARYQWLVLLSLFSTLSLILLCYQLSPSLQTFPCPSRIHPRRPHVTHHAAPFPSRSSLTYSIRLTTHTALPSSPIHFCQDETHRSRYQGGGRQLRESYLTDLASFLLTSPYTCFNSRAAKRSGIQLTSQIAEYIVKRINSFKASKEKPHFVLGLPTGSSPLPVYKRIVKLHEEGKVSFKVCPQSRSWTGGTALTHRTSSRSIWTNTSVSLGTTPSLTTPSCSSTSSLSSISSEPRSSCAGDNS